ncbi:MAG: hypothetical protein AAF513_10760 [Pseudomonadota bacterium]
MQLSTLADHWLAIALFAAYMAMLIYNAYVGSRRAQDMAGYYVGSRNMSGLAIGVSFFATFASTNSYIGHAGKGYEYGLPWLVMASILVLLTYVSWRVVAPRLRAFAEQWDALTIPDYLGSRFLGADDRADHPLRLVAAVVIAFASLLYLVAIFKGAGHLFQMFFGISYEAAVGLTLIIVVFYTALGGFVSVVRTDVIQGGLMVLGAIMIFGFVTDAAGGVMALGELARMPEKDFLFELNGGIPFAVLLGISLSGGLKLLVDPRQLSRFYALRDDRAVRQGVWVALLGLLLVQSMLFPIGVYAHLLLPAVSDTDLIVPTLVSDRAVFPLWAADFLLVAIVAAAMSSIDSVLLVAASTTYKNLIAPFRSVATAELRWTRIAVVGFACVAAAIALRPPGDIVEITIFSGSLYAVCFFPAVVLGLYWARGSHIAVLASMAVGVGVLVIWMVSGLGGVLHEVFPGLGASLLIYTWLARRSNKPLV